MRAKIMSNNVASLTRTSAAPLSVLFVVLSVLAGQPRLDARAENDDTSPAVSPDNEGAVVGTPESPEASMGEPDTSEVTRWTVDSGGVVAATGGGFELSGTIGQPDAGSASGGNFTLTGGFWFSLADGDCNTDGGVDLIDFDGFQSCFSGPGGGVGSGCRCFDVDQDADVDLSDVAAFQQAFTGS